MVETVKQETKVKLRNYGICVGVELLIGFLVVWSKGFFTPSPAVNLQILADAFFVAGILMTLFACMMFISGQGALLGISFILRNVVLAFIPMGRTKHEVYAVYRERKLKNAKERSNRHILLTGLAFLLVGIILSVIWGSVFYK